MSRLLLVEQSVEDSAASVGFKRFGVTETLHTFDWSEGVSVGAVAIETASDPNYAGTWHTLETVTFDGATPAPKQQTVRVAGGYNALRHRIVTLVEGGTLTSRIKAVV